MPLPSGTVPRAHGDGGSQTAGQLGWSPRRMVRPRSRYTIAEGPCVPCEGPRAAYRANVGLRLPAARLGDAKQGDTAETPPLTETPSREEPSTQGGEAWRGNRRPVQTPSARTFAWGPYKGRVGIPGDANHRQSAGWCHGPGDRRMPQSETADTPKGRGCLMGQRGDADGR
jgi:hypothetical protein